jgi:hypothetical protein
LPNFPGPTFIPCPTSIPEARVVYGTTVVINPILSDLNAPQTSKLGWRYFEANKIDRNELQIHKNLQKGTGAKMAEKIEQFEV